MIPRCISLPFSDPLSRQVTNKTFQLDLAHGATYFTVGLKGIQGLTQAYLASAGSVNESKFGGGNEVLNKLDRIEVVLSCALTGYRAVALLHRGRGIGEHQEEKEKEKEQEEVKRDELDSEAVLLLSDLSQDFRLTIPTSLLSDPTQHGLPASSAALNISIYAHLSAQDSDPTAPILLGGNEIPLNSNLQSSISWLNLPARNRSGRGEGSENLAVELDLKIEQAPSLRSRANIDLKVVFPHFGISLVDEAPQELLYISSQGISLHVQDSPAQSTVELALGMHIHIHIYIYRGLLGLSGISYSQELPPPFPPPWSKAYIALLTR